MATQKTQRVEVVRAFYHKGEVCGVGSILDLPSPTAFELRSANKIQFVQADTKLKRVSEVAPPVDGSLPASEESSAKTSTKATGAAAKKAAA